MATTSTQQVNASGSPRPIQSFFFRISLIFLIVAVTEGSTFSNSTQQLAGPLFKLSAAGEISITLCLNGKGPVSCQNFSAPACSQFNITTAAKNHLYPAAGIRVNTPGYLVANQGVDCTINQNGYCLFSVSDTSPKNIIGLTNGQLAFTPSVLPSGELGAFYNQTIGVSCGVGPYTFTITSGALPSGLSLSSSGVISGTPTASGEYSFTVKATDSNSPTQNTGEQSYILRINFPYAFVSTLNNSISQCKVDQVSGNLYNCISSATPFTTAEGVTISSSGTFAYISRAGALRISQCNIDPLTGFLSGCVDSGFPIGTLPQNIVFNTTLPVAYVAALTQVSTCNVNPTTGALSGCTLLPGLANFTGVALEETGQYLYISNASTSIVTRCLVNAGTGALSSCQDSGATGFTLPDGVGSSGQFVYICSNPGGVTDSVIKCTIDSGTGMLSGCVDSGAGTIFNQPQNMAFNTDGTRAYIPSRGANSVIQCDVDTNDGSFSNCSSTPGFTVPTGIALK